MPLSLKKYKILGTSNTTDLINLNTTVTSLGTTKQIWKLIPLDLRQNRVNYVPTCSNTQTAKTIIKLAPINALSGDTTSTENGIPRNTRSFVKTEDNQFIQL